MPIPILVDISGYISASLHSYSFLNSVMVNDVEKYGFFPPKSFSFFSCPKFELKSEHYDHMTYGVLNSFKLKLIKWREKMKNMSP